MGNRDSDAPWAGAFTIDWSTDERLPLAQINAKYFVLDDRATVRFNGRTGLEGKISDATLERIRVVDSTKLPQTDLASVPSIVRWFANTYGAYTPAALIHDWLIEESSERGAGTDAPSAVTNEQADRYFRYMLSAVGVPVFKRWIMWSAVALATRFRTRSIKTVLAVMWATLATAGIIAFVWSALGLAFEVELPGDAKAGAVLIASLAAPVLASLLWGRQVGAGLVGSAAALWILPPSIFAGAGFLIYRVLEFAASPLDRLWRKFRQ
ncbi:MAG: hypothetical protein ACI8Y4_000626 [Candidatus Poriferisodalaceae bacterium]|jgi:hypothetical protein